MSDNTAIDTETAGVDKLLINLPTDTVKITDIRVLPGALRSHDTSSDDIIELAQSIADVGMANKISVARRYNEEIEEHYYVCGDGARRLAASQLLLETGKIDDALELTLLPEGITDIEIIALQIRTNAGIKETANSEYVKALFRIYVVMGFTSKDELAAYVGKNPVWIKKIMKTLSLPKIAKDAIDADKIGLTNSVALADAIKAGLDKDFIEGAVQSAQDETVEVFKASIADLVSTSKQMSDAAKKASGSADVVIEYVAKPKLKNKAFCQELYESILDQTGDEEITSFEAGQLNIMNKIFSMDDDTINADRVVFEDRLKTVRDRKEKGKTKAVKSNLEFAKKQDWTVTDKEGNVVEASVMPEPETAVAE